MAKRSFLGLAVKQWACFQRQGSGRRSRKHCSLCSLRSKAQQKKQYTHKQGIPPKSLRSFAEEARKTSLSSPPCCSLPQSGCVQVLVRCVWHRPGKLLTLQKRLAMPSSRFQWQPKASDGLRVDLPWARKCAEGVRKVCGRAVEAQFSGEVILQFCTSPRCCFGTPIFLNVDASGMSVISHETVGPTRGVRNWQKTLGSLQ